MKGVGWDVRDRVDIRIPAAKTNQSVFGPNAPTGFEKMAQDTACRRRAQPAMDGDWSLGEQIMLVRMATAPPSKLMIAASGLRRRRHPFVC